jgi:hypothetical protein
MRQALEIAKGDGLAILRTQFGEHAWQACRQAVDGGGFLGGGTQFIGQLDRIAREAQTVGDRVARHLVQPAAGASDRAKALALARGLEEHVLQQVLGIECVPQPMP